GDRLFESEAATSQDGVTAHAEARAALRQTNTVAGETFWMESEFAIGSEDDLATVTTQIVTRASASMSLEMQIQSETPFEYHVDKSGGASTTSVGSGGFSIRNANGATILDLGWASNDNSHQSQGSLPAGSYLIRFFNVASADGSVTPI